MDAEINNILKAKQIYETLPVFCMDFFMYQNNKNMSDKTILYYAMDIKAFIYYLSENNSAFGNIKGIKLSDLEKLTKKDIEEYLFYLKTQKLVKTDARSRALSALRSFFKYYCSNDDIKANPAALCEMPKKEVKVKDRLNKPEVEELVNATESGIMLSPQQQEYYKRTCLRDIAIIGLLSGTGIRVSELCNIDLDDINFKEKNVKIKRKGNKEAIIEFGDVISEYLSDYIKYERQPLVDDERALFISSRTSKRGRLTPRSIEKIVEKYSKGITNKNITPHALRRSFGTAYYQDTEDIYKVADALGHKNIQVTIEHYTALSDNQKKEIKDFSDQLLKN